MQLHEREIEDFIYDDLIDTDGQRCYQRGMLMTVNSFKKSGQLYNKPKWFRQVNLGVYGILDIVGVYRFKGCVFVELIELKAVPIEPAHFEQVLRYKEGIKRFTRASLRINVECYLVGPSMKEGHYIHNNCDVSLIEYSYNLGGINFSTHGPFGGWHELDEKPVDLLKYLRNG